MHDLINPPNNRIFFEVEGIVANSVFEHPAMLHTVERVLPSFLATKASGLSGKYVELGCYLGGSTVALLDGLRRANALTPTQAPLIYSADLFIANEYMVEHSLKHYGIAAGESFLEVYRSLLGEDAVFVEPYCGDIRNYTWQHGDIALLYVDILWGWDINQIVIREFYRRLIPQGWLIHQDYIYSMYPWLPISMEWFVRRGYFSIQHFAEHSTVAFRCEKILDDFSVNFDFYSNLTLSEKQELIHGAADRFSGYPKALLLLSECTLLISENYIEEAQERVNQIRETYAHPFVTHHLEMVTNLAAQTYLNFKG